MTGGRKDGRKDGRKEGREEGGRKEGRKRGRKTWLSFCQHIIEEEEGTVPYSYSPLLHLVIKVLSLSFVFSASMQRSNKA
jgi:hypothetical protein